MTRGVWLTLAALLLGSGDASAWNAGGHRLVAAIAWKEIDPPTRTRIGELLAAHPDHARWLARYKGDDPDYAAFLEASTWADDIRRDPRFHDDDEAATAPMPGFPDMGRHRSWHYIDQPVFATPILSPGDGELDLRLARLGETVRRHEAAKPQRAYALAWLIHLVGDAHQPLHTVSRFDKEGRSDDGGNALWVETPHHPRLREMTLHAYWDDLAGPPWLRGRQLDSAADRLAPLGGTPKSAGTVTSWLAEGRLLAETVVYAGLEGETPTLDETYHQRALQTARERVAVAGKRLARLLERLLK